jgi:hypothetical protein
MLKRDILFFLGVIAFVIATCFILPHCADTSAQIIKTFTIWMCLLDLYLILIMVASYVFPKFGEWGDKRLF